MIRKPVPEFAKQEPGRPPEAARRQSAVPRFTLFAIPKPFDGEAKLLQTNAINSWKRLAPDVEVLLVGDDDGTAEMATVLGVTHVPGVRTNDEGTPLMSSAFSMARSHSSSPVLIYCNCDVILTEAFPEALARVCEADEFDQFLAIGRRVDVNVKTLVDLDDPVQKEQFLGEVTRSGRPGPIVCKEFFAFTRDAFVDIPDFAVGRGNWDNWMVAAARRQGMPVVSISSQAPVIHQMHGYQHLNASRRSCYVTGVEARQNERLGGGKNVIYGSSATWQLNETGVKKKTLPSLNLDFWLDLPRFLRLLAHLLVK